MNALDAATATFGFTPEAEPPPATAGVLVVGLPRPQTARDVLRDATTLGVAALHFVLTEKGDPSYAQSTLWSSGEWRRHVGLGLEQAVSNTLRPFPNGAAAMKALAASNEAGLIGCTQNTEILYIDGVELIADILQNSVFDPEELERERGVILHTDATQWVGKMPTDLAALQIDLASFAAHKFHGPKGVGGIYVRRNVHIAPQTYGGPQERERRGGTENVPAIAGMGVAADLARVWLSGDGAARGAALRDRFEQTVVSATEGLVHARNAPRLWNTTNIGFPT